MVQILVVEDDRFFADVLAYTLGLDGYEVSVARNARDGVRRGLANPPDVIVAAWRLKGDMRGGDVCRQIRAVRPDVKTIVVTGHPESFAEIEQYGDGVEAVITKPFHKWEILDAVRRVSGEELALAAAQVDSFSSCEETIYNNLLIPG
jgi:two-component system, OmpR family, response regulator RegX3